MNWSVSFKYEHQSPRAVEPTVPVGQCVLSMASEPRGSWAPLGPVRNL